MDLSKQTKQLLLLLLLTVISVTAFQNTSSLQEPISNTTSTVEQPVAFARNANYISYKNQGEPSMKVSSKESLYYATSGRVLIDAPVIDLETSDKRIVQLRAKSGIYMTEDEALTLIGEVRLQQKNAGNDPLTLTTERLEFNAATRFISTDQVVKIVKGNNQVNAVGLNASIDDKNIHLLSKVRGRYFFGNSDG